jgi:hypothetical protein
VSEHLLRAESIAVDGQVRTRGVLPWSY